MSADLKEKYRALVKRLYEKTLNNELAWEVGWTGELECPLGGFTVHLTNTQDADGEPLESIELKNSSGNLVDSFTDSLIGGSRPETPGVASYYELMMALRHAARRKAMGADQALDSILRDLS